MTDILQQQLHAFYDDNSKHSNYQNIPAFVRERLGYTEEIDESWRGDTARFAFILNALDFAPGRRLGDVGANTGFFTLSLAHNYPVCEFVALEVNTSHAEHIQLVVDAFEMQNVTIEPLAVDLAGIESMPQLDALLHLNVLHHAGHDFDASLVLSTDEFTDYAVEYLRRLAAKTEVLVFQIGYNWGGDKTQPILSSSDQVGMVKWLKQIFSQSGWTVDTIAFATRGQNHQIRYIPLSDALVTSREVDVARLQSEIDSFELNQFPGEFYRRPIVTCHSTQNPS